MRIDRVADDIYIFVSALYLQAIATVILTPEGAVVVDALPFPAEAAEMLSFIEKKLGPHAVRYVVLTHNHPDHTYGTYLFEGAQVVAHDRCRDIMARIGPARLAKAKRQTDDLSEVEMVLPQITFQSEMDITIGEQSLHLFHTPGHTPDGIGVFVAGDKALVAGDVLMPVPYIADGDVDHLRASLEAIKMLKANFVVQGHGDVLLRGEVNNAIDRSLAYLDAITHKVAQIIVAGNPPSQLREIDIEQCGISRIPLDGMVGRLHLENLVKLYRVMMADATAITERRSSAD